MQLIAAYIVKMKALGLVQDVFDQVKDALTKRVREGLERRQVNAGNTLALSCCSNACYIAIFSFSLYISRSRAIRPNLAFMKTHTERVETEESLIY
jgi:hypothetical protein